MAVTVSVVVPAYNSSRELRECLPALIRSTSPGLEIIVVDDASTDDTSTVAAAHGVVVLRLARNSGPGAARNAALGPLGRHRLSLTPTPWQRPTRSPASRRRNRINK